MNQLALQPRTNGSELKRLLAFRGTVRDGTYRSLAVLSLLGAVASWWLVHWMEVFPAAFLPSPWDVAQTAVVMFREQGFLTDVLASSARIGVAFVASAALGIPLALWMSSFRMVDALTGPLVDFVRYVPVPALVPIFVLWSGIGETPKFLVLFFGTFFQLVLLVKDDADNVPSAYFDLARTLGSSTSTLFRDVMIPYLLPQIYDRLRVTLGWCWTYLVIAELVAVQHGVGHVLKEAQRFNAADQMFVCFIVLGLIGLATDQVAKAGYALLFPHAAKPGRGSGA